MKFPSAAFAALVLRGTDGVDAFFVAPSPPLGLGRASAVSVGLGEIDDVEAAYSSVLDAISAAADAASSAAEASANLAASMGGAGVARTSEAMSAAQAKLSLIESSVGASADPAAMSKAMMDALDASVAAAEHASDKASLLVHNLQHFDEALAQSMALAPTFGSVDDAFVANFMSDLQHKLDALSGGNGAGGSSLEAAQQKLAASVQTAIGMTSDDAAVANFMSDLDRKLDSLSVGNVSGSSVALYGSVALVLALSQGPEDRVICDREELKRMEDNGELDVNLMPESAKHVAIKTPVAIAEEIPLEDPALAMAAIVKEDLLVPLTNTKRVEITEAQAAFFKSDAAATKTATTKPTPTVAATDPAKVAPMPPTEDVPMDTLMKAVTVEDVAEVATLVEVAKPKVVKVVTPKPKRKAVAKANGPTASPLARLLANELGLDLVNIGKGSGKNGKILIDDVRQFQEKMEALQNNVVPYFATSG